MPFSNSRFELPERGIAVMGVLNVTPDSFSDGGAYSNLDSALKRAREMANEGADIIDVGGESVRPGADPISADEELSRVLPIVERLVDLGLAVSIDTYKAVVAKEALELGACIVNDVGACSDPKMPAVVAESDCMYCAMHKQGEYKTMQANPTYDDLMGETLEDLMGIVDRVGIDHSRIWIDPGLGFGKTTEHNLTIVKHIRRYVTTGFPVLIGVSRKRSIGQILGTHDRPLPIEDRLSGSLSVQIYCQMQGVRIIRTHDVRETVRAARVLDAILSSD